MEKEPTKRTTKNYVNDLGFRLILIPVFGITIPLITGMINGQNFTNWQVKLSFLYTTFIALIVWHGNRSLHFSLRTYFDWINKPLQKVGVLLLTILFYTVPVSVLLLLGWYKIFTHQPPDWNIITETTLIILLAVIFITHVYETVFLVKDSETEMLKNIQLERAKTEAEREALKNQIDPHFIFNTLNTLSHLIEENPSKAKTFNDNLADVYRYILQNKTKDLVLLKEEIDFLKTYFALLKIRFEEAIALAIHINPQWEEQYLVPPISLQVAVENAIKHNEFSTASPLLITIRWQHQQLVIENRLKRKKPSKTSSKIGLQNLNERYKLTIEKEITIRQQDNHFTVQLPLLKII
ncbi:MAG: histidine kinase [Chitinophagaceae bacterium]